MFEIPFHHCLTLGVLADEVLASNLGYRVVILAEDDYARTHQEPQHETLKEPI